MSNYIYTNILFARIMDQKYFLLYYGRAVSDADNFFNLNNQPTSLLSVGIRGFNLSPFI